MGRNSNVELKQGTSGGDYYLDVNLRETSGAPRISLELTRSRDGAVVYTDAFDGQTGPDASTLIAARIAADIASPMTGVITAQQYERIKGRSPEQLTREECHTLGAMIQGVTVRGGTVDTIARNAEACLTRLVEEYPQDARALALLGALYAHQWWWSTGVDEPERSSWDLRRQRRDKALEYARRAEDVSRGADSLVYFAMGRAYYAACQPDGVSFAAGRGLSLTPDDPLMLGGFGNFLAYTGQWDRGEALGLKAVEIQPVRFAKWWYWTPGKASWRRDEYDAALRYFQKSFHENNWLSHLQMAYTLPGLGRYADAAEAVRRLRELRPGITRDDALFAYQIWCFDEEWLRKMDAMLKRAGLPSKAEEAASTAKP